jgi:hypothetical protein
MNVKFPNNTSKWQIEFNSVFKGLNEKHLGKAATWQAEKELRRNLRTDLLVGCVLQVTIPSTTVNGHQCSGGNCGHRFHREY